MLTIYQKQYKYIFANITLQFIFNLLFFGKKGLFPLYIIGVLNDYFIVNKYLITGKFFFHTNPKSFDDFSPKS